MPKALHNKLAKAGRKAGLKGDRLRAYIHGTMNKIKKRKKRRKRRRKRGVAKP